MRNATDTQTCRNKCLLLLLCLLTRTIPIDVFEENWPVNKDDLIIDSMYLQLSGCYSESECHLVVSSLPFGTRRALLLCLVFLATKEANYEWPKFPNPSCSGWRRIFARRKSEAEDNTQWIVWTQYGNVKYWPFTTRDIATCALKRVKHDCAGVLSLAGQYDCC